MKLNIYKHTISILIAAAYLLFSPDSSNRVHASIDTFNPSLLTNEQKDAVQRLYKEYNSTYILWDKNNNIPKLISGKYKLNKLKDIKEEALSFFERYNNLFKISDYKKEFRLNSLIKDKSDVTHLKFEQRYKGVLVYGAEIAVHINKDDEIIAINGSYIPNINIDTNPAVSSEEVIKIALKEMLKEAGNLSISPAKPELLIYNNDGIIKDGTNKNSLLWRVKIESKDILDKWVYLVGADDGKVVYKYSDVKTIKNREIYSYKEGGEFPGSLWIKEDGAHQNISPDIIAWLAYINTGIVYDYYYNKFSFDVWNDPLIVSVHYAENFDGAKWMDFLNPPQLVCGDGDKDNKEWGPACNSLDIVAHELTHAVLQSRYVNLNCCGEPGAIEESFCDTFAAIINNGIWTIGDDFYYPDIPNKYYRSLANPSSGAKIECGKNIFFSQPDHMKDYVTTSCDRYGVHINSGILNKAAYNIASAIGTEKTASIYYNSMLYITQNTDFKQFSTIIFIVCNDMFGTDAKECNAVQEGFKGVGL